MWRSDGIPAKHPTWSIVVNNHKMKMDLQQQGSYSISTENIDLSSTIEEIRKAEPGNSLKNTVDKVMKTTRMFSSNVPGTTPY